MSTAAFSADLLVAPEAAPMDAAGLSAYAQLLGGVTLANSVEWGGSPEDLREGWAAGVALGVETPFDGLYLGFDLIRSDARYSYDAPEAYLTATSLMGNVVYNAQLTDLISLYGGVGVGRIALAYRTTDYSPIPDDDASGNGWGYQAFAGLGATVIDGVTLTLEARYQDAFDPIDIEDGSGNHYQLGYNRTMVLAGVRLAF